MGRSMLPLKLIPKEKSRKLTFHKRSIGLKKKIHEISTLCGVDACLIIYGRSTDGFPSLEPVLWPSNPEEVKSIINKYQHHREEERSLKASDLSSFFEEKTKQIYKEISKLGPRGTDRSMYSTWDDRLNNLSIDQIRGLLNGWGKKLEIIKSRVEFLKKMNQTNSLQGSQLMNPSCSSNGGPSTQYCSPIDSRPLLRNLPDPVMTTEFIDASSYFTLRRPLLNDQTAGRLERSRMLINNSGPTTSYH